jgi:hypothetical protein
MLCRTHVPRPFWPGLAGVPPLRGSIMTRLWRNFFSLSQNCRGLPLDVGTNHPTSKLKHYQNYHRIAFEGKTQYGSRRIIFH